MEIFVEFRPDKGDSFGGYGFFEEPGIFRFELAHLQRVRDYFVAQRTASTKASNYKSQQRRTYDFDWNAFLEVANVRVFLLMLENGDGTATCPQCAATYPNSDLIVYDWRELNHGGSDYECPLGHSLYRDTHIFFESLSSSHPDERSQRPFRPYTASPRSHDSWGSTFPSRADENTE